MLSLERTVAKELQDNVRKTLAPYLGLDNFEISVAARLNTDKRQINETNFNPEGKAERSVRTVKETGSSQNSNSQPARPSASSRTFRRTRRHRQHCGEQNKKQNERREELTNYEVSSKTIQTVSEGYKIENLTIAVVVNRKRMLATLGEGAKARSAGESIEGSGAAGRVGRRRGREEGRPHHHRSRRLPAKRPALEPVPGTGIMAQLMDHTGSLIKGITMIAITMLLIWFGLRPATKALLASERPAEAVSDSADGERHSHAPGIHQAAERRRDRRESSHPI